VGVTAFVVGEDQFQSTGTAPTPEDGSADLAIAIVPSEAGFAA